MFMACNMPSLLETWRALHIARLRTPLILSVPHLVPIRADSLPGARVFWDEWTAWTWKRGSCPARLCA